MASLSACSEYLMASSKLPGVYITETKNGKKLYRASITHKRKHISLGSFPSAKKASAAYTEAGRVLSDPSCTIHSFRESVKVLPFEKYVCLVNLRDHGIYFANPIYLEKTTFSYYLSPDLVLTFDTDDLFYYSQHKITKRGRHYFVADYGSQISVPSRYGIKNYAIPGRDYRFINGDTLDFRHENIEIFNPYYGIRKIGKKGQERFQARIHIRSYYVIGDYPTMELAAIAYNKAVDILHYNGFTKNYPVNYIDDMSPKKYADLYADLRINDVIYALKP